MFEIRTLSHRRAKMETVKGSSTPKKRKVVYKNLANGQVVDRYQGTKKTSAAAAEKSSMAPSASSSVMDLPVRKLASHFLDAFRAHATVVLVAETGSGKSTQVKRAADATSIASTVCSLTIVTFTHTCQQVPQLLFEAGLVASKPKGNSLVCTQPRRMAAITLAQVI
jgi:HrpA-like RNA helicase